MFAFFGLGIQELILLAVLGGGALVAVFIVVLVSRSANRPAGNEAALEAENRRLREELDRDRNPPP